MISSSPDSNGTRPISFKYIRTGSSIFIPSGIDKSRLISFSSSSSSVAISMSLVKCSTSTSTSTSISLSNNSSCRCKSLSEACSSSGMTSIFKLLNIAYILSSCSAVTSICSESASEIFLAVMTPSRFASSNKTAIISCTCDSFFFFATVLFLSLHQDHCLINSCKS